MIWNKLSITWAITRGKEGFFTPRNTDFWKENSNWFLPANSGFSERDRSLFLCGIENVKKNFSEVFTNFKRIRKLSKRLKAKFLFFWKCPQFMLVEPALTYTAQILRTVYPSWKRQKIHYNVLFVSYHHTESWFFCSKWINEKGLGPTPWGNTNKLSKTRFWGGKLVNIFRKSKLWPTVTICFVIICEVSICKVSRKRSTEQGAGVA